MIRTYGIFILGLLALTLLFASCTREEAHNHELEPVRSEETATILYWTCGMHPSVRITPEEYKKGQSKCPICNMDLVSIKEGSQNENGEGVVLQLSDRAKHLATIRTSPVLFLPLKKEIRTAGVIEYDERKRAYVAARIPGRIDKLFVDFTGKEVKKGDPLVWLYSPELISTQQEYLLALETLKSLQESHIPEVIENAESLVESTKKRLLLWGITNSQIESLRGEGKASTHMTIHAPISGTVIEKTALDGKYVKEGENLYSIVDLSSVWMRADIFEEDLSLVKNGQEVVISSIAYPGESYHGKIAFIDPFMNDKTRSVKVRVDVPNGQGRLKPGMYVDASIEIPLGNMNESFYTCSMHPEVAELNPGECPECGMFLKKVEAGSVLAVPKLAVLDVGIRKLVFIEKGEGRYESHEITLGSEGIAQWENKRQKYYHVLDGLEEGEKVVTRANFLLDSQTQLTGEAAGVYGGALGTGK